MKIPRDATRFERFLIQQGFEVMENKLKDLRSEDAKTEDALSDISKDLGL